MFEPSLTVGLVPRIANRVVATHNYPATVWGGIVRMLAFLCAISATSASLR
jgi:hypothetical protein